MTRTMLSTSILVLIMCFLQSMELRLRDGMGSGGALAQFFIRRLHGLAAIALVTAASIMSSAKRWVALSRASVAARSACRSSPCLSMRSFSLSEADGSPLRLFKHIPCWIGRGLFHRTENGGRFVPSFDQLAKVDILLRQNRRIQESSTPPVRRSNRRPALPKLPPACHCAAPARRH